MACPDATIFARMIYQLRQQNYRTVDGDVELHAVAIPTAAEAELTVGKVCAALPPILAVNTIEPLSAAAVAALGLTPGIGSSACASDRLVDRRKGVRTPR